MFGGARNGYCSTDRLKIVAVADHHNQDRDNDGDDRPPDEEFPHLCCTSSSRGRLDHHARANFLNTFGHHALTRFQSLDHDE